MSQKVFLSYSSRDQDMALAIERELAKLGVSSVGPSHTLTAGADLRKSVVDAMRKADSVIVLITEPFTATSSWTGYEVGTASALGKDVLVVKPSSISVGDLPSNLTGWHTVDLDTASPDKTARALVSNLTIAA